MDFAARFCRITHDLGKWSQIIFYALLNLYWKTGGLNLIISNSLEPLISL